MTAIKKKYPNDKNNFWYAIDKFMNKEVLPILFPLSNLFFLSFNDSFYHDTIVLFSCWIHFSIYDNLRIRAFPFISSHALRYQIDRYLRDSA